MAFAEVHIEALIDRASKMNYIQTAEGIYLDAHARGRTDPRKGPVSAFTTVEIHFSTALTAAQTIPQGTRVTAGDGIYFATDNAVTAPVGATAVSVRCVCLTAGTVGNGYTAGAIRTLVDTSNIRFFSSLANTDTSSGGADTEDEEAFRERILTAPETYSTAGSEDAYVHLIKKYDANISDVITVSPSPGVVMNYIAMKDGDAPSDAYLADAEKYISGKDKRPLTDNAKVTVPAETDYTLDVTYFIAAESAALEMDIRRRVEDAAAQYVAWQSSRIGRDIDPSELIRLMKNAGASRVAVTSPTYTALKRGKKDEATGLYDPVQIARCIQQSVTYGGLSDG